MSEVNLTEEQLKKISSHILSEIEADKQQGIKDPEQDPLVKEKLIKMVEEQVQKAWALASGRQSGEFNEGKDLIVNEEIEKALNKQINEMKDEELFGVREIKMLMSKKQLRQRHGDSLAEQIEEFKELQDTAYLVGTMLAGAAKKKDAPVQNFFEIYKQTEVYGDLKRMLDGNPELRKALAVATSGSGAEWIPTGFSSQVLLTIELQLRTPQLFTTLNMPTSPWTMPVQTSNATGYFIAESTADEATKIKASTPGTGNATFTARKLAGRVVFSEEINEDSIVNVRGFTNDELAKAISRAWETAVINGDRTGAGGSAASHQDNAGTALFTSDQDARLAFDGLRYFALNQTDTSVKDASNAVPSDALMGATRLLLGKHGVMPSDLVWISSVNSYLQAIFNLSNIQTLDKYGPQATILSGEVLKYQGIPWVVSEYIFSNLNATGVYDGSTTDRSKILCVYRPGFYNGTRGAVTLSAEQDIETDQIKLVAKRRVDFVDPYDATATGNVQCATLYNVKTT